jgi:hypothetical protein
VVAWYIWHKLREIRRESAEAHQPLAE